MKKFLSVKAILISLKEVVCGGGISSQFYKCEKNLKMCHIIHVQSRPDHLPALNVPHTPKNGGFRLQFCDQERNFHYSNNKLCNKI